ncbi:MAG: transketolase [Planctomycetes bacterium]|nr:transketolase [Planctomycetota bacterium]
MSPSAAMHKKAAALGKLALRMTTRAGSGHPSSALSLAHVVTHLMYHHMRYDPANPWHPAADRLVLSEGHAVPIVYAAYADLGGVIGRDADHARALTEADLDGLRDLDSVLEGHPNPAEGFPFFDAATGSLGQGLSVAAGLALGARLDHSRRRVYVLIGDGEAREGQVWEALDFIVDNKLTNVCAVFNCNMYGQAGEVSQQQSAPRLTAKLEAFGWKATSINGHEPAVIAEAFARVGYSERPVAIVARTVKGWGVEELLQGNWHGKPLPESALPAAEASLDQAAARAGNSAEKLSGPTAPAQTIDTLPHHPDPRSVEWPPFAEAMQAGGLGAAVEKGQLATRQAYGAALKTAGDLLPHVVALDGDVSNSTFTAIFAAAHPERFFECKIAEQNMVSVAAGLSAAGYIPFVNSFAKFLTRAADQVEMANITRANIKLVGSHAGISLGADGPSQMGLLDVAFFQAFSTVLGDDRETPLCRCYHPADAVAAYHCTRLMVAQTGMCYMRTHRPAVPVIYDPDTRFEPGGFNTLETGGNLAIVTAGYMVHVAKEAVEALARKKIRATLIDAYTLPIDALRLGRALQQAGGVALIVEDNYGGGLGAAVAEIAARTGSLRAETLCCQRIPKSARTAEELLNLCGVGCKQIVDHARALLARPGP